MRYGYFPHFFENSGKEQHGRVMKIVHAPPGDQDLSNGTSISKIGWKMAEILGLDNQSSNQSINQSRFLDDYNGSDALLRKASQGCIS